MFSFGCYGSLPDVCVDSVRGKLHEHMDRCALGCPVQPLRTVRQTVEGINKFNGCKMEGDLVTSIDTASSYILKLLQSQQQQQSTVKLVGEAALITENNQLKTENERLNNELCALLKEGK